MYNSIKTHAEKVGIGNLMSNAVVKDNIDVSC